MRVVEAAASLFGWLLRAILLFAGPYLFVYGIWLFSHRVAFIVAGAMLIILSLQRANPSKGGK